MRKYRAARATNRPFMALDGNVWNVANVICVRSAIIQTSIRQGIVFIESSCQTAKGLVLKTN
jgi:hypothetical protein